MFTPDPGQQLPVCLPHLWRVLAAHEQDVDAQPATFGSFHAVRNLPWLARD